MTDASYNLVKKELEGKRELFAWSGRMAESLESIARSAPDRFGFLRFPSGQAPMHLHAEPPIAKAWVK